MANVAEQWNLKFYLILINLKYKLSPMDTGYCMGQHSSRP